MSVQEDLAEIIYQKVDELNVYLEDAASKGLSVEIDKINVTNMEHAAPCMFLSVQVKRTFERKRRS